MDVQGHELRARDIPACVRLLQERYAHEQFDQKLALKVFPDWILRGILKGWIAEGGQGELLCFGASVFITDRFVERLWREPVHCIGAELLRMPGIGQTRLAQHGVNILIFHSGSPPPECDANTASRVKSCMMQGFLRLHGGYPVNQILVEAFGESERVFYGQSGFVEAQSAPDNSSHLLVLTRERISSLPIHPLLALFTNASPKCLFSLGEQAMLSHAVEGHTDEELASILCLSVSAIKKRWVSVFQRAEGAVPEIPSNGGRGEQKRGAQKRHLLLRYLRNHPEELRPFRLYAAPRNGNGLEV